MGRQSRILNSYHLSLALWLTTRPMVTSSFILKSPEMRTFAHRRSTASALHAKPKQAITSTKAGEADFPNLRRKVRAKRPLLGHIVPSTFKKHGGSSPSQLRPQGIAAAGTSNPSMLRIGAGSAKGRRLYSPNVYLRPMMGKVRDAVFSTFTSFGLYDPTTITRHLDVFAGSGSVGLESLSRGAAACTFVDLSQDCCDCIRANLDSCQFDGKVVCGDALLALRDPVAAGVISKEELGTTYFQVVTICPPYEEVVYGELLDAVANSPLVSDDTVVLVEYPIELGCLPHVVTRNDGGIMVGVRNRKYGRTVIAMYVVNPTGKLEVAESRPEEFVNLR